MYPKSPGGTRAGGKGAEAMEVYGRPVCREEQVKGVTQTFPPVVKRKAQNVTIFVVADSATETIRLSMKVRGVDDGDVTDSTVPVASSVVDPKRSLDEKRDEVGGGRREEGMKENDRSL